MSVFRRCYDFVSKGALERVLSRKEKFECLTFAGLVPLLFSDVRRKWSDQLLCTDASPDGFGICERVLDKRTISDIGRWNERWRYKRLAPEDWAPRRRALGVDPFSDASTVLGSESMDTLAMQNPYGHMHTLAMQNPYGIEDTQMVVNDSFPEVPCASP